MKRLITLIAALLTVSVFAQSNPGLQYGQIPSAGQWNSFFGAKQDYYSGGIPITNGGTGSVSASGARANLGLGTIATQDANNVNITGGTISGVTASITNLAGGAIGAVPYQSAPSVTTFLLGNTTTSPQFFTSTGSGSAALAPTLTGSTGTGSVVLATSPTVNTPTFVGTATAGPINSSGAIAGTTFNKVTVTTPATGSTLTIADTKTLTASNTLTLAGTDSTTMTFPSTSASIARIDSSQTFLGTQTFSGVVAGTALSTYLNTNLASPPAIGGTVAAAGSFTTLSATSTVSGAGFTAFQSSPNPIGSVTPNTGAFTTLSASSTVSGTGFSTYLASPPAIGGSAAAAVTGTTVRANTQYNVGANLLISANAPTISSGFGTSPSIAANNGPSAFRVNVGSGSTASSGVVGLPTAATGWNCFVQSLTNAVTLTTIMTASTTTTATFTSYNGSTPTAWAGSTVLQISCFAY